MNLTRKQKRTIDKYYKTKDLRELSSLCGTDTNIIENYLKNNHSSYYHKINIVESFDSKSWFKNNYLILILIFILITIAYANSLNNKFLSDDIPLIQLNNDLLKFSYIFIRPFIFLRNFFYAIIFKLFGAKEIVFRLMNVFFHIGSCYLFLLLLSQKFSKKVAVFSTLIFAVHPIIGESITWISGGYYTQYGFFILLSLFFYSISLNNKKYLYFSLFAFCLSLLSAERSVILPLIIVVWELSFGNIKKNWKNILPFFIVSSIWVFGYIFGAIQYRIQSLQTSYYQKKVIANPLTQLPISISSYFELLFWPKKLTLYHSEMSYSKFEFTARSLLTFLYFVSIVFTYFKNKKIFFLLSFFFITLIPALTPLGISWVVAERYVYLGSIGIIAVFAFYLEKLLKLFKSEYLFYFLLAILIAPLTLRTIARNIDWKNQDNLWIASDKYSPNSHQNHNNLGDYYVRHNNLPKAVVEFQKAIAILPNYADAYHNMATTFHQMGRDDLAVESYQKATDYNPNLWQSYQNLGAISFSQGNIKVAQSYFIKATEVNPQNPVLHTALGIIYLKAGQKEKGKEELSKSLMLDPNNQEAKAWYSEANKN